MNGFPWQRDWRNSHQPSRIALAVKNGIQEKQRSMDFVSALDSIRSNVTIVVTESEET